MRLVNQSGRSIDQIVPVRRVGDYIARQYDLAIVTQPRQRFRNFISAEVRSYQQRFGFGVSIVLKLGPNANIDVMRRARALSQELNLCVRAEIRTIGVGIEHCSAGNGVLFGRIADYEAIADKRENR